MFCPRTLALNFSLCLELYGHFTFLALSHFPSHSSNITSSERSFLILCILSKFLPDNITCYYLVYRPYRTYPTNFLSHLFTGLLSICPRECKLLEHKNIFCLVPANDLPQCLAGGTFSINTNKYLLIKN